MKNILLIAILLIISAGTAQATDSSFDTESYINKKRAAAKMVKQRSDKKISHYQYLIANKKTFIKPVYTTVKKETPITVDLGSLETAAGEGSEGTAQVVTLPFRK